MKKLLLAHLFSLIIAYPLFAQNVAEWSGNKLVLDNGHIRRDIIIENGRIFTKSLNLLDNDLNFDKESDEFSFLIDGQYYDGASGWKLVSFKAAKDELQGNGATLVLDGTGPLNGVGLEVTYLLYPGLPIIRKQIAIINNSSREVMLEALDVEKLKLGFHYVHSIVYHNYGRQKHLGSYIGNWDDPILAVHSYEKNSGIILGNESPGVLKRTSYNTNTNENDANIGLTHTDDIYPFRKYIKSGERWASPRVFIIPYVNVSDPWQVMNTSLSDFERRHMGLRIFNCKDRPVVAFNTWRGFREDLNDSLMLDAGKAASECGMQVFTIDYGWFENQGDWHVDRNKFPNGLDPVFAEFKRMDMEAGLWISVATTYNNTSEVLLKHPEWAVVDKADIPTNLHSFRQSHMITMCFGTEWKDYIQSKIAGEVDKYGLKYVKLDLAVLSSAYINDNNHSGCYSENHPYHKDRNESFIVIYERLFDLFDELHKKFPELYIDCTFEVEGKLQLIDYAFCQHAEGNWLTNVEDPYPVGAFRIRNLAWWKSPAVPASSLLIGNIAIESPYFIEELKSMVGSVPIVLGDPRKLSAERRKEIKLWAVWLKTMQGKYNYDLYRQDLTGFGEPSEGNWDGWSRINTDTKEGGIAGIFKQGSLDEERTVTVAGLNGDKLYIIKEAPDYREIVKMTGKQLQEKGFKVKISQKYGSRLFEIEMTPAEK